MRRGIVFVVAGLLLNAVVDAVNVSAQPSSQRSLDCATYSALGAIACDVRESWIAPGTFPHAPQQKWPPAGYTLIKRGLLSETKDGQRCVVPVRSLQRLRTPVFSETDVPLPPLHEGFPECPPKERLTPDKADYEAVVRRIREVLPRPSFRVQPDNNTLIGIHTRLEISPRALVIDTQTTIELPSGPKIVHIRGQGAYFVRWREAGDTTGPYVGADGLLTLPAFHYDMSGDEQIDMFDVWTVHVTADDMPTFHDIVYLGYPPLGVRVNELVIRVVQID